MVIYGYKSACKKSLMKTGERISSFGKLPKMFLFLSLFFLSFSGKLYSQFSLEKFYTSEWNLTLQELKTHYPNEKFEEKDAKSLKAYTYFSWLDPVSIRVSFLFSEDGTLKGKMVSNANKDADKAQKLFTVLKQSVTKKYGDKIAENSLMGINTYTWKTDNNFNIMLSQMGDRAVLTIMKK